MISSNQHVCSKIFGSCPYCDNLKLRTEEELKLGTIGPMQALLKPIVNLEVGTIGVVDLQKQIEELKDENQKLKTKILELILK